MRAHTLLGRNKLKCIIFINMLLKDISCWTHSLTQMAIFGTAQEDLTLGEMYKIYNGLVQCPIKTKLVPTPHPTHPPIPRQRRTHCQQLGLITTRTQYQGSSLLPCTIRDSTLHWCSRGNDCWHFCVTCLPLTSQLVFVFKEREREWTWDSATI